MCRGCSSRRSGICARYISISAHVEKGDKVAVSVGVEQPGRNGEWVTGITRGIVLQGLKTDPQYIERDGLYIGQGITMLSRAGIFRDLSGLDVLNGDIFLQNLPSIIIAHVLDQQQGERIIDMCAAPGGKTTAIASLMKDKGEVIAVDRSHNKVVEIHNLAEELGLNCITACKLDALKSVHKNKTNATVAQSSSEDKASQTGQQSESANFVIGELVSSTTEDKKIFWCYLQFCNTLDHSRTYGVIKFTLVWYKKTMYLWHSRWF